jgi:hypothetical protein
MPPHAYELILVRETITHLSGERLFQCVTESQREMLVRGADNEQIVIDTLRFHDPRERIVGGGAFAFIVYQPLDIFTVGHQERALEVDKATRNTFALLLARGADGGLSRPPVFVLINAFQNGASRDPAPIGVNGFADFAEQGLVRIPAASMATGVLVDALRQRSVRVSLVCSHGRSHL